MIQSAKPFFSLIIRICVMYANVVFYTISLLYYTIFGRRLVELLDSSCFYAIYRLYHRKPNIILLLFGLNTLLWFISDTPHILQAFPKFQTHYYIISIVCFYVINILNNFVLYVIFYYQHATKVALIKIENSLSKNEGHFGKFKTTKF